MTTTEQTQLQPPAKKRGRLIAILIGVFVSILVAGGLGAYVLLPNDNGTKVVYDIDGTGVADITYSDGSTLHKETAKLPWHKEITVTTKSFLVKVEALPRSDGHTYDCTASVNGKEVLRKDGGKFGVSCMTNHTVAD